MKKLLVFLIGFLFGGTVVGYWYDFEAAVDIFEQLESLINHQWGLIVAGGGMTVLYQLFWLLKTKHLVKQTILINQKESMIKKLIDKRNAYYAIGDLKKGKAVEEELEVLKSGKKNK